jgi:hypothetical protein
MSNRNRVAVAMAFAFLGVAAVAGLILLPVAERAAGTQVWNEEDRAMLLHSESAITAAVVDPDVRSVRLRKLRLERTCWRYTMLLCLALLVLFSFGNQHLGNQIWPAVLLVGCFACAVRTGSQIGLLLALDRLEEMVARRAAGDVED